jgi:hypothetical protein
MTKLNVCCSEDDGNSRGKVVSAWTKASGAGDWGPGVNDAADSLNCSRLSGPSTGGEDPIELLP